MGFRPFLVDGIKKDIIAIPSVIGRNRNIHILVPYQSGVRLLLRFALRHDKQIHR